MDSYSRDLCLLHAYSQSTSECSSRNHLSKNKPQVQKGACTISRTNLKSDLPSKSNALSHGKCTSETWIPRVFRTQLSGLALHSLSHPQVAEYTSCVKSLKPGGLWKRGTRGLRNYRKTLRTLWVVKMKWIVYRSNASRSGVWTWLPATQEWHTFRV